MCFIRKMLFMLHKNFHQTLSTYFFEQKIDDLVYFTTRVPNISDTSDTSATRTPRVRHGYYTNDTSAARATRLRHKCKILIFIITRVKTYFHTPILGEEQFHSRNYLFEMHRSHAKMRFKSAPEKMNYVIAKSYIKKVIT